MLAWQALMVVKLSGERKFKIYIETATEQSEATLMFDPFIMRSSDYTAIMTAIEAARILAEAYEEEDAKSARNMAKTLLNLNGVEAQWAWGSNPGEFPPMPKD